MLLLFLYKKSLLSRLVFEEALVLPAASAIRWLKTKRIR